MFELLRNILIAIGALVVFWLIGAIVMSIHDSNNETYAGATSLTDDSLEKKYKKLLKMLGCDGLITTNKTVPHVHVGEVEKRLLWFARTETVHDYLDEVEKNGSKKGYRIIVKNDKWYLQGMIITKDGEDIKVEYSLAEMYLPNKFQTYFSAYDLDEIITNCSDDLWEENEHLKIRAEEKKRQEEKDKKLLDDVNKSIDDYMKTEDPKLKELRISSYFDCKGMVQTIQDLNAIKDPQDGDKYLFLLKGDTVDNYLDNHRTWVIRIVYIRGDWYINHLHVNTEDHGDGTISISFYSIDGVTEKIDMVSLHVNNMSLDEYVAFQYLNQNSIINAHILSGGEFDSMFRSIRRVLK